MLTPKGVAYPVCPAKICGDYEDMLSVDCTYGYMKTQTAPEEILAEFYGIVAAVIQARFSGNPNAAEILNGMTIREMMQVIGFSGEKVQNINQKLKELKSNQ